MKRSLRTKILTAIGAVALVGGAVLGGAAATSAPVSPPAAAVYQNVGAWQCVTAMNGYTRVCNHTRTNQWLRIG